MGFRSFNDRLALILLAIITGLWVLGGRRWIELPPEVTGALIVTWTLVVQFFFRKPAPPP